jgi:hypothetical protein
LVAPGVKQAQDVALVVLHCAAAEKANPATKRETISKNLFIVRFGILVGIKIKDII